LEAKVGLFFIIVKYVRVIGFVQDFYKI